MSDKIVIERRLGVETNKKCQQCKRETKVVKFISKKVIGRSFKTDTKRLCFDCYDNKVVSQ